MRLTRLLPSLVTLALWVAPASGAAADLQLSRIRLAEGKALAPTTQKGLVELTLVPDLQARVERLLEQSRAPSGAIVMSDVRTGRVLAWASRGDARDLVRTPVYPGASIYKVVTAAALLEGGHVHRPTRHCFGGAVRSLSLDDVATLCRAGESKMPFGEALGYSVNSVFGRLAVAHLDRDTLARTSSALGLDGSIAFDLEAQRREIPVPDDKLGLARTAAGFSPAGVSPLGALFTMQTIANRGERVHLWIQKGARPIERVTDGRAISEATANALTRMMEVTTRRGTSHEAFEERPGRPNVLVAGKTGTLAVHKPKRLVSWFAGFAPSRSPEVAISVVLANDMRWWRKANQVARDALDAYFESKP